MKNTMKKLLCMALAIMLLVSAVPVFAMAEGVSPTVDLTGKTLIYSYRDKDTNEEVQRYVGTQALDRPFTYEEITNSASMFFTRTDYRIITVDPTNPSIEGNNVIVKVTVEKVRIETFSLVIELVVEGEGTHEYNVGSIAATEIPEGGLTMSRADALIKLNGQGDAYDITAAEAHSQALTNKVVFSFSAVKKTNTGSGSGSGSGTGSNTGTVAQFKVTFLNVNGIEFYSEYVTANNTITASADFLNSSVGTKAGYEHIGWKANSGSTKTTNVVLTDKINANVTYAPVFKSLADNSVVIPGGGSSTTSNGNSSSSGTTTNKFPYDVYLNIYKDTLVGSADKSVKITNGIALDGLVTLAEVKNVVKNYYTAKDSDGISYDGLYLAQGNWVANYVADTQKYDSIKAGEMRQTGTVYINVMIGNAKAKSTATADTSNPKTGDTIFVPFMVMGVTATALAAAYVFGKKRIAR